MRFRVNIDREMVNTGTKVKPFIFAAMEQKEYFWGPIKYCSIRTEKRMDNIGDDNRPYFVKVFESLTTKIFGIVVSNNEQSWKYNKL